MHKDEFRKLQRLWYAKLAGEGFNDIEQLRGSELLLKVYTSKVSQRLAAGITSLREEYFRLMAEKVHDGTTPFRSERDRYILTRHTEGAMVKTIREELIQRGESLHRKSIEDLIKRYQVAWKLYKHPKTSIPSSS